MSTPAPAARVTTAPIPTPRATPPVPAPVAALPSATTPQLLKQGMYASIACSVLLFVGVLSGVNAHREAMKTIGRDTAPSIIAAQHVAAAAADMDANAVNELLFARDEKDQAAARKTYDDRRKEAADILIDAAENIKYDDERQPVRTLALALSTYAEQTQHARDLRRANDPGYIEAYRAAARTLDESLLPAAQDLDHAKRTVFDRTYAEQLKWASASMLFLVLTALALCGVLLAIQVFLTRRMRRVINPLLLIATGLAVLSFFFFAESFTNADHALKVAKQDAFESIHALWKARALGYSANADESRYLLDSAQAAKYQESFLQKADRIYKADGSTGFLVDEEKNITFPGELDAAQQAVSDFVDYRKIDGKIRQLEQSGKHLDAIRLCTGESNAVFDKFDHAVGDALQINQTAFDQAVKDGFDAVKNLEMLAAIACAFIALLAVLGLLPRLREYSAA